MNPRILVLKAGTTDPAVRAVHGDYDDWFVRALEGLASCEVIRPFQGEALPDPSGWDGLLISGSPLSVRDEAPWMMELGRWALDAGKPLLGVCFGHQLLGEVLGGRVEPNPQGLEVGTVPVSMTEAGRADPLFLGLPETFSVQATHKDILVRPPPGTERLAGNPNTLWQAFAYGPLVRAVQFHPELPPPALESLIRNRGQQGEVQPFSHGPAILRNWVLGWLA